jgi:adenylate cyclase
MNSEDARSFAQKLAVAYFVQGTIRRSGARIRITVHLAEVASERRLWSEHYDREIQELPIIHDEVSRTIAATIGGRVEAHRARQALDRAGVQAYDLILRAKELHYRVSKSANAEALPLLEQAIEIDPNNARAHAWLASVHVMNGWFRWTADPDESTRLSVEYGRQAVEMDDSDYVAHYVYAEALHGVREWAIAESHFERALQLNPNDIAARSAYCLLLVSTGRAEEAVQHMVVAERLDPFGLAWTPWVKGAVMFTVGRYKEAIRAFSQVEDMHNVIRPWLAAAYAHEGDLNQARLLLKQFFDTARAEMGSFPGKDLELWQDYLRSELAYREESDFLHVYEVLLKAGWQELIAALPDSSQ